MPLPDKISAIIQYAQPTTVKGLQDFIEMVNFYHRFIPGAAGLTLFDALAGKPKTLTWIGNGKDNPVADSFSRSTIHSVQLGIDYFTDQAKDPEVQSYRTTCYNLVLQDIPFETNGVSLLCDISTGNTRPVVPASWRHQVFDLINGLSHPSICTTRTLLPQSLSGMGCKSRLETGRKHVSLARKHVSLARVKRFRHIKAPLQQFSIPHRHFDHIHVLDPYHHPMVSPTYS